MARRKGGGSSAARSAAAKKGWETRRRNAGGGGKGKSKATTPSAPAMARSGGKMGKSAKNTAARAKYKAAASNARETGKTLERRMAVVGPNDAATKSAKKYASAAKSALTRISNNLSGKSKRGGGSKPAKATTAKTRKRKG